MVIQLSVLVMGKGDSGFMPTCVCLIPIILLFLSWLDFICVKVVGSTGSYRTIWKLWEVCLPYRHFFLVGDDQSLFIWGHPSLVDEAGPKVVTGEGEMDGRAHGTA